MLPDIGQDDGCRIDVVDGNVEKPLNLIGVQVHGEQPVNPDRLQHVGNHLCTDWDARRPHPAVLSGIAKIGDRRRDATCRGASQRVGHEHDLHEVIIGRRAGRLQDKDIPAPHMFENLDSRLAVREAADR